MGFAARAGRRIEAAACPPGSTLTSAQGRPGSCPCMARATRPRSLSSAPCACSAWMHGKGMDKFPVAVPQLEVETGGATRVTQAGKTPAGQEGQGVGMRGRGTCPARAERKRVVNIGPLRGGGRPDHFWPYFGRFACCASTVSTVTTLIPCEYLASCTTGKCSVKAVGKCSCGEAAVEGNCWWKCIKWKCTQASGLWTRRDRAATQRQRGARLAGIPAGRSGRQCSRATSGRPRPAGGKPSQPTRSRSGCRTNGEPMVSRQTPRRDA